MALEDEHLLSEGDDLTISVVGHQTTKQSGERREK